MAKHSDRLVRAFVQGAQWWEWNKTGATMWASDRDFSHAMAESRLHDGTLGLDEAERIEHMRRRVAALQPRIQCPRCDHGMPAVPLPLRRVRQGRYGNCGLCYRQMRVVGDGV
jgi:hypothetical protein